MNVIGASVDDSFYSSDEGSLYTYLILLLRVVRC